MTSATERVKKGFSETRTVILGAQILMGFEYEALFQPRFKDLPDWAKAATPIGYFLLLLAIACMIAPTPFHRLAERGRATVRQCRYLDRMVLFALLPFALALGGQVTVAASNHVGTGLARAAGIGSLLAALILWYGVGLVRRNTSESGRNDEPRSENMALKDRIGELLEESRIILPGVQALLGFQLAAYLSDGFAKLPEASKTAHTLVLLLLVAAMILLMAPTPYHRLGERGQETESFDRVGTGFVLSALVPLALAVAADFYVVLQKVTGSGTAAITGAAGASLGCLILWFAVPLIARSRSPARAPSATQSAAR